MALKIGPVNGHTVMLDAQSDPEAIWILCSCGANLNIDEPPSGKSLKEAITRITDHVGMPSPDDEVMERNMKMFDALFPE